MQIEMAKQTENGKERRETKQTKMERAMTGQKNLNADADRARSFSQDCKGTSTEKRNGCTETISKPTR